ncbi:baculoviral IAP repeat-containing protein 7 [Cavia porcellus]|uniref:baculoviral IAP repeat-containing protein 7 n=1 Tax=Cavia porcellus TaxID=10141 RepID=UPI0006619B55|nr:baculoviral IAP repeat-containing protein 7 [Cavia porcellus]
MGPEGRTKCLCYNPELGHWAASNDLGQDQRGCPCQCSCVLHQDHVDGQILGQLSPLTEQDEEEGTGATSPAEPAFPGMGSEELRLASFYNWPLATGVQPELLAAAGFFHTGQQDKVRCFFCYGGLQSWEHGDDPWTEHAKWFPRCQFLLQSKGRGFVHSVQEAYSPLLSSWDRWEEPEDAAPASPTDARGRQEWSAWEQDPDVPISTSASLLGAGLLQEEDRDQAETARAPGAGDVQEQLRRLQEERRCKVCLDRPVSVVFVPCGHLVCAECAPSLQLCPICRAPIRSCVRTFLS